MRVEHIRYPLEQKIRHSVSPSVAAIGFFDGVHRGHQALLKETREMAERLNLPPGVMTFDPHPREVLGNGESFAFITPLAEKLRQMEEYGMDVCYVLRFDHQLASLSPHSFVKEVLMPLQFKGVVVGFNHTFGHRASGTAEDLRRLGAGAMQVRIVEPVRLQGAQVSSTRLREALQQGEVETVARWLGRPYRIHGIVVHGAGRGKKLGFPTANIRLSDRYVMPRTGIYAVKVAHGGNTYYGTLSIGFNPTFESIREKVFVEVYILDYSGDLYGDTLYVNFLKYLRPEAKFASVEALIAQMREDVRQTRELASQDESAS